MKQLSGLHTEGTRSLTDAAGRSSPPIGALDESRYTRTAPVTQAALFSARQGVRLTERNAQRTEEDAPERDYACMRVPV